MTAAQSTAAVDEFIDRYGDFIAASPTAFHAAANAAEQLKAAGFSEYELTDDWEEIAQQNSSGIAGSAGFVLRDGAIIAWRVGADPLPHTPFNIWGAHSDSPGFVLKPNPNRKTEAWAQANVEVYGGVLLNSWLDRDLEFAGRVFDSAGNCRLIRTGPVARIAQLAVHLDREVNNGLKLDRQLHTQPIIGVGEVDVAELLADAAGIPVSELAAWDVSLADTQLPARIGAHRELFAAGRQDNLSSTYAGLAALIAQTPAPQSIAVLAVFDHEEVGSGSTTGAGGPLLQGVIERLQRLIGADTEAAQRSLAASWVISADASHAVHPNYAGHHDPETRPQPGKGPVLKHNANQRYATTGLGAAKWRALCEAAGVKSQDYVANNTIPCGSTIGPITAERTGINTVDVGAPLLSMHSCRELSHVDDLYGLAEVAREFFRGQ